MSQAHRRNPADRHLAQPRWPLESHAGRAQRKAERSASGKRGRARRTLTPSTAFASVDHAELRLAASGKAVSAPSVVLTPRQSAPRALEADALFTIRASADDAFVVIVSGGKPMRPMLSGDDEELTPWAMSGAIWIDANGDGKSLARELVRR